MQTGHPNACSLEIGKCFKDLEKMVSGDSPSLSNRVAFAILVASKIAKFQSSVEVISC